MSMLRNKKNSDQAISPVIGTILMIAATVIIAGAVYAAVNLYSGKTAHQTVDASWKAQAIDANNDGSLDTIKVTYITGPSSIPNGSATGATVTLKNAAGTAFAPACSPSCAATWSPGDFQTWSPSPGTYYVTVSQSGTELLDQTVTI